MVKDVAFEIIFTFNKKKSCKTINADSLKVSLVGVVSKKCNSVW